MSPGRNAGSANTSSDASREARIILSDLLHKTVRDHSGHKLGATIDARFCTRIGSDGAPGGAHLVGLIVSKRSAASFRGYERSGVESPSPIAQLLERQHRGSFLVEREDIERIDEKTIRLRTGFTWHPSTLPSNE
jgi:hypothetical protein